MSAVIIQEDPDGDSFGEGMGKGPEGGWGGSGHTEGERMSGPGFLVMHL